MRFAGSGAKLNITPFQFSGRGGKGIGAAGGMATGAEAFQAVRSRAPKYGNIGKIGIASQGAKGRAVSAAEAAVHRAGMSAQATVKASEIRSKYMKDAAAKQAKGAMIGSALGAVGSIASAFSDEKTKDCIERLYSGLDIIRNLEPVTFHYTEEYTDEPWRMHYGFIAQDYERVMPNQVYKDPISDLLKINTNELIAVLVKSIQELESRLEALEK